MPPFPGDPEVHVAPFGSGQESSPFDLPVLLVIVQGPENNYHTVWKWLFQSFYIAAQFTRP